jgi:4-hydroxybenzoate polyprenyltransferase
MAAYHTSLNLHVFWTEMFRLFVAAFIVRSTACAINDVFDREFDAGVGMPIVDFTTPSHLMSL